MRLGRPVRIDAKQKDRPTAASCHFVPLRFPLVPMRLFPIGAEKPAPSERTSARNGVVEFVELRHASHQSGD
jgi:hypothetical protein